MLICLEGPSAVGKTSTCKLLESNNNAFIVKETIFRPLEGCSLREQALFYLRKEVERWKLAREKLADHPIVVMDSDPLKPLWFNWAFSFVKGLPLSELDKFFRPFVSNGEMGYPDKYFVLTADEDELFRRRKEDKVRRRPEFEKLSCINEPRLRYYDYLSTIMPGVIERIEIVDIKKTYDRIRTTIKKGLPKKKYLDEVYYTKTISWLTENTVS